jgi:hypothetical protein
MKVFPNPLTSFGTVQFDMVDVSEVKLRFYSIDGRLLKSLNEQRIDAGAQKRIQFDTSDLSTGTYIIQVQAGNISRTSKFVKTE